MTESQAIAKATEKKAQDGAEYLVINRQTHPRTGQSPWVYVTPKDGKWKYADDETLVFDTSRPQEPLLDVMMDEDGSVHIHCDQFTAARLGARAIFGKIPETQQALVEAVRDAWYEAGCP